jgi:hypothetical protein
VAWKEVELSGDEVDLGSILDWTNGDDEGAAYALTHIYSPQAASITLQLSEGGGEHVVSGWLNGSPLPSSQEGYHQIDLSKPLALQAGWNELLIRYTLVWGDTSLKASLVADPAMLWKLKIGGPPSDQP